MGRDLAYRVTARLVAAGLQALGLVLVARSLGPATFGHVIVGVAVGSVLASALGFGIPMRGLRLALEPDAAALANGMRVLAALGGLTNGSICAGLTYYLSGSSVSAAVLAAAMVGPDQVVGSLQAVLAGESRPRASANVMVLHRLVSVGCGGLIAAAGREFSFGYAAGALAFAVLLTAFVITRGPGVSLRAATRGAGSYVASGIAGAAANLDVVLVSVIIGPHAAGVYGAATRLVSPLAIAVSSLTAIIIPSAAARPSPYRRGMFRRAYLQVGLFGVVLSASSPLVAIAAVEVLGPEYVEAKPIIIGVAVGVALSGLSQVVQAELVTAGLPTRLAVAVIAGTTLGFGAMALVLSTGGSALLWSSAVVVQGCVLSMAIWVRRRSDL